ncbi:MAG: nicotinate-nucleotide adenylyltransferase [Candidatus Synoicihabitans palmerolidicus]|nr:nicotinate-nucleotide adenylyltransferase [Candidatus Synoicihabitans palmerolidicus]
MKIGLMGGSFDPVHFGHLVAAQDAMEQYRLDRLVLIPAAQAPMKAHHVHATGHARVAMVKSAVDWDSRFEVSDFEVKRGGVSYTVDTATYFRTVFPDDELYWIMGGDQVSKLGQWKDIEILAGLVEFIYLERPGHAAREAPLVPSLKLRRCNGHLIEISSTELRQRLHLGFSLDYFVPHNAIEYIQQHRLYRT